MIIENTGFVINQKYVSLLVELNKIVKHKYITQLIEAISNDDTEVATELFDKIEDWYHTKRNPLTITTREVNKQLCFQEVISCACYPNANFSKVIENLAYSVNLNKKWDKEQKKNK